MKWCERPGCDQAAVWLGYIEAAQSYIRLCGDHADEYPVRYRLVEEAQ